MDPASPPQSSSQRDGREPPRRPSYRVKLLSAVNSMPPLPTALNRLLGMLNDETASAGQIAQAIEQDSVLSGSVLRCVNSAYYGLPGRVSSIRQAVTLLGFGTVRNVALAFSMRRMISRNQPAPKVYGAYSRHALGCAIMTQFAAHLTRSAQIEAAFAAGLLHDIGKLLILSTSPEALPEVERRVGEGLADGDAERDVLETTHAELSGIILESWKLPEALQTAVRFHHNPDEQPGVKRGATTLAHLVQAADAAVNAEGIRISLTGKASEEGMPAGRAFARVGVDEPDALLSQFREEFAGLQGVFQ